MLLSFLLTSLLAQSIHEGVKEEAQVPIRRQATTGTAPALSPLGVSEFLQAVGAPPASSPQSIRPSSPAERKRWEEKRVEWRAWNDTQLKEVRNILENAPPKTETREALVVIKDRLESWKAWDERQSMAGPIYSDATLEIASQIAEAFLVFGIAYNRLAQPGLPLRDRETQASEEARKNLSGKRVPALPKSATKHHRDQFKTLVILRNELLDRGSFILLANSVKGLGKTDRKAENITEK